MAAPSPQKINETPKVLTAANKWRSAGIFAVVVVSLVSPSEWISLVNYMLPYQCNI